MPIHGHACRRLGVFSNFLTRSPAGPIATDLHKPFFLYIKIAHVYLQQISDSNSIATKPICTKLYQISFLKSPYCGTHLFQKISKRHPTLQSSLRARGLIFPRWSGPNDSYTSIAYFATQTIGKKRPVSLFSRRCWERK